MSFYRIRPRSGTKSQWENVNPVLALREIGIEVPDNGVGTGEIKMKMGDGVTAWNDLPYATNIDDRIVQNATTDSETKIPSAKVVKDIQDQITDIEENLATTNSNLATTNSNFQNIMGSADNWQDSVITMFSKLKSGQACISSYDRGGTNITMIGFKYNEQRGNFLVFTARLSTDAYSVRFDTSTSFYYCPLTSTGSDVIYPS